MGRSVRFSEEQQNKYKSRKQKREIGTRKLRKRFLIVCEGTKTEPNYFEAFKKDLPRGLVEVDVHGVGANTLTIVQEAKKTFQKSARGSNPYDEVWVVFDRDSFPADNFDNAIHSAKANNFGCAWSNEAFELWYLLHFEYRNTGMVRTEYKNCLGRYIGEEYKKNDPGMYEKLKEFQNIAIQHAERLMNQYPSVPPSLSNPGTQVHLLVIELNSYFNKYVRNYI
ncbi:MAG: RloB domain-containing protein [Spirochaetales bacterium]|nr:RloB domain-containing protein [Spirochaetales bacterium]